MKRVSDMLKSKGVKSLYHFTDIRNLPSILEHEKLLSKQLLQRNGIWQNVIPGGNELSHALDNMHNNDAYVSLAYTPYLPMAFHRKRTAHLCFLEIDLPVVDDSEEVLFTTTNATANNHRRGDSSILDSLNFNLILGSPQPGDEGWKEAVQAEVLVYEKVDLLYIKGIHFVAEPAIYLIPHHLRKLIADRQYISPKIFSNKPDGDVCFPYVKKLEIASNSSNSPQATFSSKDHLMANIWIYTPPTSSSCNLIQKLTLRVQLYPLGDNRPIFDPDPKTVYFPRKKPFSVPLGNLNKGQYVLKVSLKHVSGSDFIIWGAAEFAVQ